MYAGYWREIDGCIGACKEFTNDTAKDGLLHLTMFYAARDAAKARTAHTGLQWKVPQQWTRLHQAALKGLAGRVAELVASPRARTLTGATRRASRRSTWRRIAATPPSSPRSSNFKLFFNAGNVEDWAPLHVASYSGHAAVVAALLTRPGVDPDDVAAVYVDKITRTLQRFSVKFRTIEAESYAAFQSRGQSYKIQSVANPGLVDVAAACNELVGVGAVVTAPNQVAVVGA